MTNTILRVGRSYTGTSAREPDESGSVERDGVRTQWERYGYEGPPILLLSTWSIVHSRQYGATAWLEYADATAETIVDAVAEAFDTRPAYRTVEGRGAPRAAELIAELL